jgi:hypothetical protein
LVKSDRGRKVFDKGIGRCRKASTPEFFYLLVVTHDIRYSS